MSDPLFLCCVWNERMHCWVDVASSFDRGRCVDLAAYLALADCRVEVAIAASDTVEAIEAAVIAMLPPSTSFSAMMTAVEEELSSGVRRRRSCVADRRRSLDE